jgi:hypothetical protein
LVTAARIRVSFERQPLLLLHEKKNFEETFKKNKKTDGNNKAEKLMDEHKQRLRT